MSIEFRGIREHWKARTKSLQIKLMEGGLESVALNKLKRPDDIDAIYWNAQQNVRKREKAESAKRKEKREHQTVQLGLDYCKEMSY